MKKKVKDIAEKIQKADGIVANAGFGAMAGFLIPAVLERYMPYEVPQIPAPFGKIEILSSLSLGAGGLLGALIVKRDKGKILLASMGGSALAYALLKIYSFYENPGARARMASYRSSLSRPMVRTASRNTSTCVPCNSSTQRPGTVVRGRLPKTGTGTVRPAMLSSGGTTPYPLQRTPAKPSKFAAEEVVRTVQSGKIIYA